MHSLLPLVARKLANECDMISTSSCSPFAAMSRRHEARHWRSGAAAKDLSAGQEHVDRDVIPVFNRLTTFRKGIGGMAEGKAKGKGWRNLMAASTKAPETPCHKSERAVQRLAGQSATGMPYQLGPQFQFQFQYQ
ncbi:hypothetical protein ACLKA6_001714 [Drosophila palustris]